MRNVKTFLYQKNVSNLTLKHYTIKPGYKIFLCFSTIDKALAQDGVYKGMYHYIYLVLCTIFLTRLAIEIVSERRQTCETCAHYRIFVVFFLKDFQTFSSLQDVKNCTQFDRNVDLVILCKNSTYSPFCKALVGSFLPAL